MRDTTERAEIIQGLLDAGSYYKPGDFGKSEMKTYAPLVAWIDGPLLAAVQQLADRLEEYEVKLAEARKAAGYEPWQDPATPRAIETLPEHPKSRQKQPRD
jgi:hypothetical protein